MSQDVLSITRPFSPSSGPSKLAAWTTCGLVVCACISYVAWSLSDGAVSVADMPEEGVTLSARDSSEIRLKTPNLRPANEGDETPLELDNSIETDGLPVINAHLEVPTSVEPLQLRDLPDPQLRQLSHESAAPTAPEGRSAGAWLTGTIESPLAGADADSTISRYVR